MLKKHSANAGALSPARSYARLICTGFWVAEN